MVAEDKKQVLMENSTKLVFKKIAAAKDMPMYEVISDAAKLLEKKFNQNKY